MPAGAVNNVTHNDNDEFIRSVDDQEMFVKAVLNINSQNMRLVLTCKDHEKPGDKETAVALAMAYGHAGMPIPIGVFKRLGNRIPNPPRRRLYSSFPMSEHRYHVRNLGRKWDEVNKLNGTDGAVHSVDDHNRILTVMERVNFPRAGVSEPEPEVKTFASLRRLVATSTFPDLTTTRWFWLLVDSV